MRSDVGIGAAAAQAAAPARGAGARRAGRRSPTASGRGGIAAQRKAVADYLNGGRWKLRAEFTEVESGKRSDRPELAKALAACKRHKAKLVAKIENDCQIVTMAPLPLRALQKPQDRFAVAGGPSGGADGGASTGSLWAGAGPSGGRPPWTRITVPAGVHCAWAASTRCFIAVGRW